MYFLTKCTLYCNYVHFVTYVSVLSFVMHCNTNQGEI